MPKTKVYHVVKSVQGWKVEEEGSIWSLYRAPLRKEAVEHAMDLVKKEKDSRIVIFNEDGSVQQERCFSTRKVVKEKNT